MYKIDNQYQKARIKNLEQWLDFQKYNIKEKKKKRKKQSHKNYYKTTTTTTELYIYMAFALKIGYLYFF